MTPGSKAARLPAARHNPFRSERVEALRFRLSEGDWSALLDRLAAQRYRGAIVGPKGSGKTTLLLELAARLRGLGFAVDTVMADGAGPLSREASSALRPRARSGQGILLLDGADRLGWWSWRRLRAALPAHRGLVVTLHRPGRLETLHTCRTSPALLAELVTELMQAADDRVSAARGGAFDLDDLSVARLFRASGGDLRQALRRLYDRWAVACAGGQPREASARGRGGGRWD